jgi:hypothetical protein
MNKSCLLILGLFFFSLTGRGQITPRQKIEPNPPLLKDFELKCADLAIERFEIQLLDKLSDNSGVFNYYITVKNKGNADYKAASAITDAVVSINKHNGADWQYYLFTPHFDSLKAGDTVRFQVRGRWNADRGITSKANINNVRALLRSAYNRRSTENCNRTNDEIVIPANVFREALASKD